MLNFLRKMGNNITEARLNSAYWQIAGYVKNEYHTSLSQHTIAESLKNRGYDATINSL